MELHLRKAELVDLDPILDLFRNCVFEVCKQDYAPDQLTAWASASLNTDRWMEKILNQFFIIALSQDTLIGFGSLQDRHTIDLLYVHKDFQKRGVADTIYKQLLREAQRCSVEELKAEVSKTARPFFEKRGFRTIAEQLRNIQGATLVNYAMVKTI
jgi:putative acetyltransferase